MNHFYLESYGCQMNLADSESIAGILTVSGMEQVHTPDAADLIIVNTCTVRESAVSRVLARISRFKALKKNHSGLKIAVAGCLAQHEKDKLFKSLSFIDYVVGPDQYRFLAELSKERSVEADLSMGKREFYSDFKPVRKKGVNAWIPIMRGCNNYCAYCIVPYVRGREASKPVTVIDDETRQAVDQGFVEVTLLGQNVNSYKDRHVDFPGLLRRINGISGLKRIRFMTSHPKDLSDNLIQCFADLEHLCEYLHLPVQSGSDAVLERMNRRYSRKAYLAIIEKLRKAVPHIALSTDILCGFPGETKEDHKQTMALMKEVEFDSAFMFIYSRREGTQAANYKETLGNEEKVSRVNEIIARQMDITKKKNRATIGKVEEVLVEGLSPKDKKFITARTRSFKNVIFKGGKDLIGKIFKVKITGSTGWALQGEVIE